MSSSSWRGWSSGAGRSCSVGEQYIKICVEAVENQSTYDNFKNIESYSGVVTGQSEEQGKQYLKKIQALSPALLEGENLRKILKDDSVGNPVLYSFENNNGSIKCSSNVLRYANVLAELVHFFGPLDDLNIIEIGGGYGGQCRMISDFFNFKSYTIVDLEESCRLAKKYLDSFCVKNIEFKTRKDIQDSSENASYDLIISNYGLSELDKENQEFYLENILRKSSSGYVTYNSLVSHRKSHLGPQWPYNDAEMYGFLKDFPDIKSYNENVYKGASAQFLSGVRVQI